MEGFEKVVVYGVSFDPRTKQPIVLLQVEGENRLLPIGIGRPETVAILMKLQKKVLPRPLTHDLLASVIDGLSASLERVAGHGGARKHVLCRPPASGGR